MKIHNFEQRSPEWFNIKLGKISGSTIQDIYTASKAKYIDRLVAERLTQVIEESFVNDAMQWGIDHEEMAINTFMERTKQKVQNIGFVEYNNYLGCSPDGIIFKDKNPFKGVEVKCPKTKELIAIIRTNKVPVKHLRQCLLQLFCMPTMESVYYIVFDPRLTQRPMHVIEIKRSEYLKELEEMEEKLNKSFQDIEKLEDKILFD
jgi:hypothetical protein